ncbi:MAG: glycosyltransferase family 2 protein [Alcanivoracaceae bacterium]|nr:glycosyltransferase family 2 protein [Alcanivoracaceae bacterium]
MKNNNTTKKIQVSLVIPVFNNNSSLEMLSERLKSILNEFDCGFEIIFINDCSQDGSLKTLIALSKTIAEVVVVDLKYNIGQHAAVFHGLRFVKGECCIIMDADLQDPPESIVKLLEKRSVKFEAIFAGRVGKYQNAIRMMTSKIYKSIINKLTGLPKNAGIYMLIEKPLIEILLKMPVRTLWINVMVGLSCQSMHVIPVKRNLSEMGVSSYTSLKRIKSALNGLYCAISFYLFKPKKGYLMSLKEDPVSSVYR